MLRIQVIDEGPGIPEDRLTLIFEKFHREDGGDPQRAGPGLGLAIRRGRPGRHSEIFTVELPISADDRIAEPEAAV